MAPTFLPRLVNGPFDDPALFVPIRHNRRALLFDLGDISALSPRDILKVSHVFVSHTHVDHFYGFDRMLRVLLGRNKDLYLYGPQGFLHHLEGKLAGYCWNLVKTYHNSFTIHATALHPTFCLHNRYVCQERFRPKAQPTKMRFDGVVLEEPALMVRAVHLDHGTPVLAFRLDESVHLNIDKIALQRMGIAPGAWLKKLKAMILAKADNNALVTIPRPGKEKQTKGFPLGVLAQALVRTAPGQKMAYVTDAAGSAANFLKIITLAHAVDHLFVEAAFSDRHRDIAERKNHLTARQAGEIARRSGARQYTIFHHSPRYTDCPDLLAVEAETAFRA